MNIAKLYFEVRREREREREREGGKQSEFPQFEYVNPLLYLERETKV